MESSARGGMKASALPAGSREAWVPGLRSKCTRKFGIVLVALVFVVCFLWGGFVVFLKFAMLHYNDFFNHLKKSVLVVKLILLFL